MNRVKNSGQKPAPHAKGDLYAFVLAHEADLIFDRTLKQIERMHDDDGIVTHNMTVGRNGVTVTLDATDFVKRNIEAK